MKLMVISDIHGLKTNLELIKEKYYKLKCDKLIVLGDIYYSSIRNTMLSVYDPEYIEEFLKGFKDNLICIRGNCDSEQDINRNYFVTTKTIENISIAGKNVYFTHGHIYNDENWNKRNTILIFGHYHVPFIKKIDETIFINPGSISLPRGGSNSSYLIIDNDKYTIFDVDGNILDEYK